jgi:hypothetical protein
MTGLGMAYDIGQRLLENAKHHGRAVRIQGKKRRWQL